MAPAVQFALRSIPCKDIQVSLSCCTASLVRHNLAAIFGSGLHACRMC